LGTLLIVITLAVGNALAVQDGGAKRSASGLTYITGNAKASSTTPMLVCLHGAGDSAENFLRALNSIGGSDFRKFHVVVPRGPNGLFNEPDVGRVADMVKELLKKEKGDPRRTHVMGFSRGAYISVSVGATRPEHFATMAGFSGGIAPNSEPVAKAKDVRAWLVHGTADQAVPIAQSENAKKKLEGVGCKVTFHRIQGWDHRMHTEMFQAYLKFALETRKGSSDKERKELLKAVDKGSFELTVAKGKGDFSEKDPPEGMRVLRVRRSKVTATRGGKKSSKKLARKDVKELKKLLKAILDLDPCSDADTDHESIYLVLLSKRGKGEFAVNFPSESAPRAVTDLLDWLEKKLEK
jgi:predicted esterase